MPICNNCGYEGTGNYCAEYGKHYEVKRLTVSSILHEVAHLFTHLDKGFLYTLKLLIIHPGRMQKEYILGKRDAHQKPFSMFFICATITGLVIYWVGKRHAIAYDATFGEMRLQFYHSYFIILQTALTPLYTLMLWLFFRRKDFNYAECLVMFIYTFSFMLLLITISNMIDLIPHSFKTYYVEIPLLTVYVTWTNLNFFREQRPWLVIVKSIASILSCWLASNFITNQLITWMQ